MRALLTVAAVTILCATGCSAGRDDGGRPGTLVLGTANVTVNDTDAGLTDQVACSVTGPLTTITTGTGQSGVTALVYDDGAPTARAVSIRNLAGFTGDYHVGSGAPPTVTRTGRSYAISGTADGFLTSQPAIQTRGTFAIDVAC